MLNVYYHSCYFAYLYHLCVLADQVYDSSYGVHLVALTHGGDVVFTVLVEGLYGLKEGFLSQFFFLQDFAVSQAFEGTGVENLVSAAGICGKWNQKIRFFQSTDFTDCVGSGS